MPDDDKPQGAQGDKEGADEKQADGKGSDLGLGQLQGVLSAQLGKIKTTMDSGLGELREAVKANAEGLKSVVDLVGAMNAKPDDKGGDGSDDKGGDSGEANQKLLKMERQMKSLESQLEEEKDKRVKAEKAKEKGEYRRDYVDALVKAGCTKPEAAFKVLGENGRRDEDTGAIVVDYKHPEHGEMVLPLDEYVEEVVRPTILPELFANRSKGGPDAGGHQGGKKGGKKYEVTHAEWSDPEWISDDENYERLLKAEKAGTVEPAPPDPGVQMSRQFRRKS